MWSALFSYVEGKTKPQLLPDVDLIEFWVLAVNRGPNIPF